MTEETAVATIDQSAMALQAAQTGFGALSPEKRELLKRTVAVGATDDELEMFIEVARGTGLNPFAKQIYAIKRQGKMTIQTGIDGFRLIAQRSGKYRGQEGPYWCGPDGVWVDVWLAKEPPAACKVGILHADMDGPQWVVGTWDAYYQDSSPLWKKMGPHMLAKCVEALGLRRYFPQELASVYANEEMEQADSAPSGSRGAQREAMRNATVPPQGNLRERLQPRPEEAELPDWAREIINTVRGWDRKVPELAPLLEVETVTPSVLRAWGNKILSEGGDPFKVATDWLRAKIEAEKAATAAEAEDAPIDGEARELPDDEAAPAETPAAAAPTEEATERVLDLPFED